MSLTHEAPREAAASEGDCLGDAHQPAVLLGMVVLLHVARLGRERETVNVKLCRSHAICIITLYIPESPGRTG